MVRLKQRYVLFDILYPPKAEPHGSEEYDAFNNFSNSPEDSLIRMHKSSPKFIDGKLILQAIRRAIQDHYGEIGAGSVGQGLIMKYFSNKTSTGIIRCTRQTFPLVVASLALIDKLGGLDVVIVCTHISGTIKKCEEFSITRSKELMNKVSHLQRADSQFGDMLGAFENTGNDLMNMNKDSEDEESD